MCRFTHFNIEWHLLCAYDSVTVFDGEQQIANLCGTLDDWTNEIFITRQSRLRIRFRADSSVSTNLGQASGFQFVATSTPGNSK